MCSNQLCVKRCPIGLSVPPVTYQTQPNITIHNIVPLCHTVALVHKNRGKVAFNSEAFRQTEIITGIAIPLVRTSRGNLISPHHACVLNFQPLDQIHLTCKVWAKYSVSLLQRVCILTFRHRASCI